jgi:hypothetical protein
MCPIVPPRPLRTPLHPALQLTLDKPAESVGDSPLAGVAAVQVDQCGPRANVEALALMLGLAEQIDTAIAVASRRRGEAGSGQSHCPHDRNSPARSRSRLCARGTSVVAPAILTWAKTA